MSFIAGNQCTQTRVKMKDGIVIQVFSLFYMHPGMINEESWHLISHGNFKVLVDEDTLVIMKDLQIEWGFKPRSDTIISCKLSTRIPEGDERKKQMHDKYEYAKKVRSSMNSFFDKKKIDDLSTAMNAISIENFDDVDCSENDLKQENILEVQE